MKTSADRSTEAVRIVMRRAGREPGHHKLRGVAAERELFGLA